VEIELLLRRSKKRRKSLSSFFAHRSFFPVSQPKMSAVDVAFKATCATLFATALASGAWLTASMWKGYNDATEYQVRKG